MARVCVIPLVADRSPWPTARLASFRSRLAEAGYSVTIDTDGAPPPESAPQPALVAVAWQRLRVASGTYLVLVDMAMSYSADDVVAVVERLEAGPTSLVVAARRGRPLGSILRRLVGTSDPTSGLVGLTRGAVRQAKRESTPVGSRFVCELLARVPGKRAEVEVDPVAAPPRPWAPMDDIRHAKRIADDRLGNLSRLLQFCFVGASGMVVDLSAYAALQTAFGLTALSRWMLFPLGSAGSPISGAVALAAVLAIAIAMTWNFSLNRRLTFNDARHGSIAAQYLRYVLSNLAGVGVSLAFRLLLPSSVAFFAAHRLMAAVAGIIAATGISFSLARWFVFQSPAQSPIPALDLGHHSPTKRRQIGPSRQTRPALAIGARDGGEISPAAPLLSPQRAQDCTKSPKGDDYRPTYSA